jgi:hypothetical protein
MRKELLSSIILTIMSIVELGANESDCLTKEQLKSKAWFYRCMTKDIMLYVLALQRAEGGWSVCYVRKAMGYCTPNGHPNQ